MSDEITDENPLYQPGAKVDMIGQQQALWDKLAQLLRDPED